MTTAFNALLIAASTALLQAPALAAGRIAVGRDNAMPLQADSDINITLQAQDGRPFAIGAGPTDWTVDLGVELRARGSDTVNAVDAIDPLAEAVYARLMDINWPAGVQGVSGIRARLDVQEAATPLAAWQFLISIQLRTAPGSLALSP